MTGDPINREGSAERPLSDSESNKTQLQFRLDAAYSSFKEAYIKKCTELEADIDAVYQKPRFVFCHI